MKAGCRRHRSDRGIALIVVLFLTAILTLMMYGFLRETQVEYALSASLTGEKQAEQLCWSGIEKAIAAVTSDVTPVGSPQKAWYDNPDDWYEIELFLPDGSSAGVFSLVAIKEDGTRFGISDEASKIDLNMAPREILMKLPGMTEEIADSIIDWRDTDETVTGSGGEGAYYGALQPGYACKNGAFDTVEELLLVKGITPEIVYGEDINQNGVLDPGENDGEKTLPRDNGDGILDRGLIAFVSVYSYDRNLQANGQKRVNINTADTQELTQALGEVLSPQQISAIPTRRTLVAAAVRSPGYRSGADLMEVTGVAIPGIQPDQYRKIADRVTTLDSETVPGLININTAPRVVLEAMPGWTADDVSKVIEHRSAQGVDLSNSGWLTEVLPLPKVQSAAPYVTVHSYQFRMDAVGRVGPRSQLEASSVAGRVAGNARRPSRPRVMKRIVAVFDNAASSPRLLYARDASRLGTPYPIEEPPATP